MIQKTMLSLCLVACSFAGFAQSSKKPVAHVATKTPPAMTSLDSASYSFGLKIAMGLKSDGVKELNYQMLSKAMEDVFAGKTPVISDAKSGECISAFLQKAHSEQFSAIQTQNQKFLEENKKKPNVVTLPSGLQYEILNPGNGPKPTANDRVTVHYKGTLIDGKQFDSSYDRNEPLTIELNNVIPGWTEGVQLMPIGAKYRFYIPYQLGYGERGAGQDIPPYSTLIFDIELLKIGK
ncbi:MAG: FKBP-type peptidyl-prolyl cis-trans isomerase [Sphingobacteriales bacterium]|nr:FKBP-type peptidyl-prolyl cis-trans isomerase [Sphingobacteriales bacterium]